MTEPRGDETILALERELARRGRTLGEWFTEHLGTEAAKDWAMAILYSTIGERSRPGTAVHIQATLSSVDGGPWTPAEYNVTTRMLSPDFTTETRERFVNIPEVLPSPPVSVNLIDEERGTFEVTPGDDA